MSTLLFKNGRVVFEDRVEKTDLLVKDGVIDKIGDTIPGYSANQVIDIQDKYLLPGFIDIHTHGGSGFDFTFGQYDADKDQFDHSESVFQEGIKKVLKFYYQSGITKVLFTTEAGPIDIIEQSFLGLQTYLSCKSEYSQIIEGINLEGTFLKDPDYAGAQNPKYFYDLDYAIIDRLIQASGGLLKIVNLPPEHGSTGLEFIKKLKLNNIVVAGGHSAAYGDEYLDAVEAGLTLSVHFLNGPSRSSYKSFRSGGAVEAMLSSDQVYLELICDGYHVDPSYVRDSLARKGGDKLILITDSMFANGLKGIDKFSVHGLHGRLSHNKEYLQMEGSEDTLFGSVLAFDKGYSNVLNWLTGQTSGVWHRYHKALTVDESLLIASKMASTNPAKLLGLDSRSDNRPGTGSIKVGKCADLIVSKIEVKENIKIKIQKVYVEGVNLNDK